MFPKFFSPCSCPTICVVITNSDVYLIYSMHCSQNNSFNKISTEPPTKNLFRQFKRVHKTKQVALVKFVTRFFFVRIFVLHVRALSMGILSKIYIEQTWYGFWWDCSTHKEDDDDDAENDDVFSSVWVKLIKSECTSCRAFRLTIINYMLLLDFYSFSFHFTYLIRVIEEWSTESFVSNH